MLRFSCLSQWRARGGRRVVGRGCPAGGGTSDRRLRAGAWRSALSPRRGAAHVSWGRAAAAGRPLTPWPRTCTWRCSLRAMPSTSRKRGTCAECTTRAWARVGARASAVGACTARVRSGKFVDGVIFESSRARGFAFEFELGCGQVCTWQVFGVAACVYVCVCVCGGTGDTWMGRGHRKDVKGHARSVHASAGACVRFVGDHVSWCLWCV